MSFQEIVRLKYAYCHHLDHGNVEAFMDLFTDDARFEVPNYGSGRGREAIRNFVTHVRDNDLPLLVHMATNPVIEIDGDEATGLWYYIVLIDDGDSDRSWGQGRWEDKYRRVDGTWKIESLHAARQYTASL